jgi:DNA gyrase subunit B
VLVDERPNPANRSLTSLYHYPNGIADFLRSIDAPKYPASIAPFVMRDEINGIKVAIGFQFTETQTLSLLSFANSSPTVKGGTHVRGFLSGLADGLNALGHQSSPLTPADFHNNLIAFIAVWLADPRCDGAVKAKLINPEVEIAVRDLTSRRVREWAMNLDDNAKWMVESLLENRLARKEWE